MSEYDDYSPEALNDYLDALVDLQDDVERQVRALLKSPRDAATINSLFRSMHTLKSNAAMCRLEFLVDFAHPLEDVMSSVRAGSLVLTPLLGEIFLLGVDRIKLAAETAASNKALDGLNLNLLATALAHLAQLDGTTAIEVIPKIVQLFGGELPEAPATEQPSVAPASSASPAPQTAAAHTPTVPVADTPAQQADLQFFRHLALLTERRCPFWQGRTDRQINLARMINEAAGCRVDSYHLTVAIYMHDVGMSFLSEGVWLKQGKLNDLEQREMRLHPMVASEMAVRMYGLADVARMIGQHHERPDGRGYPQGLSDSQICDGAKIIAIIDAFEAMTHERGDRYHKRSILRAVTEINACDGQFSRDWIGPFNAVSRQLFASSE